MTCSILASHKPDQQSLAGRILHVITCLDVGGAEIALKKLVTADPMHSTRHVVVSLRDIGSIGQELQVAGVKVHALNMRGMISTARAIVRLVQIIERLDPVVIQTWMYHGDLVGGLAARVAGRCQVVWGIHNTGFSKRSSRRTMMVMKLCAWTSRLLPQVIVCCADSALEAHVKWGYNRKLMRVISNGFDCPVLVDALEWRESLRQELGIAADRCVVGMVARFDPLKDHRGFVQAAKLVAAKHRAAKFMLVGRDVHTGNQVLMQWIREAGLEDFFVLLGERRDIDKCLAAMDIFCLSSIYEAFPNAIGEAMAMGLPCVVTDAGDAARIVGKTGWVVQTSCPPQLAEALANVIALSPEERRERGMAARLRVLNEFSMARTRELFEQVYLDAQNGK